MFATLKNFNLMHVRAFVLTLSLILVHGHAAIGKETAPAVSAEKVHRVVFQVTLDGEDNWNKVLNQIENLKKGFAPDKVEIEVVTHGDAGGFVLSKNTAVSERIQKIEATGVQFALCANTQKKNNIKAEEITPGVTIVPAGIVEVIKRQEEGWSYVKAGN